MSIAPSLKTRIRKLEHAVVADATVGIAERMRRARERRSRFTPLEAAVSHCAHVGRQLEALTHGPAAAKAGGLLGMRYRGGKHHLEAMAALDAPDVPYERSQGSVDSVFLAWSTQQGLREKARKYLDALALIEASDRAEVTGAKAAEATFWGRG